MVTMISGEEDFKMATKDTETEAQGSLAQRSKEYWSANIKLLLSLLVVWFAASFGCGILFVDQINQFTFLGVKFGFWMAQQGSILVFVALIFIYGIQMKKLEKRFGVED